ncbi:MAG: M23 family metallopeptidase [Lysobacteraceae bacterium]|nr:MAG: M23 family metallopeptidase [Xanthomonadaceae bacterium]
MLTYGDGPGRKQRFKQRLDVLRDSALHHQVRHHLSASRWNRRQWIHASLFTTIGVLLATIVPGFSTAMHAPAAEPHAVLALELPEISDAKLQGTAGDSWQIVKVRPGQTLGSLFKELGIPRETMQRILKNADARAALTRLKPGTELAFDLPVTGGLRTLRYDRDADHRVELSLAGDALAQKVVARETTTRTVVLSGKVGRSLNRSARKAGLTSANINSLTDEIFKYDIDFDSDLDADDRFSVVVDQTWREGELVSTSPVLAATFTVDGKLHSGFRFARPKSKPEFFTAQGRPLKKTFIRMPIPYARLSSKFGARRHPVLGSMRMHKGVDYAASTGTPIMAAGDSRVEFIGWQRGYGNTVILNHGRGYTTLYGHMSRTAKLRKGQSVAQGTVIGYVGSTGMSTGPHLHYEFRVNGAHRNPLSITMPPPEPLAGAQLAAYRTYTANALARIRTVENIIYADVEPAAAPTLVALAKPTKKK